MGPMQGGRIDRRIRHAMRILENEQAPLPETTAVAARVGMSLFHFVRLFKAQVGLSPQDYGRSIILMHAASRLRYSDEPVAIVARDFGYAKQATFNKAFTRHHGKPPALWRREAKSEIVAVTGDEVSLEHIPTHRVFARRYFGPRDGTGAHWADFSTRLPEFLRGLPRMDFSYDDPRVTPPERIRHDCAVVVEDDSVLPIFLDDDGFELLESPAGLWAVAGVTPYGIGHGYRAILDGWFQGRSDYAMEGDPFLERWTTTPAGETMVSVCVRVRPIDEEGKWNMPVVTADAEAADTKI